MLRNTVPFLFLVAASVAIPAVYQSSPFAIQQFLEGTDSDATLPRDFSPRAEAVSVPAPRVPEGRRVRFSADANGHFVSEFKLNGRRVTAMVDTGATTVALNRSTARSIGIPLAQSDFKYEVRTANGIARAATVVIDNVSIGRIVVDDVQAAVLEDDSLAGTLVGMSFLSRLSKFQIENGSLLLEE